MRIIPPLCEPTAHPANTWTIEKTRLTFISERLVRIEWSPDGAFEDRPTLSVVNRTSSEVKWSVDQAETFCARTEHLRVMLRDPANPPARETCEIRLSLRGQEVIWRPGDIDSFNLPGTTRTLDSDQGGYSHPWKKDAAGNSYLGDEIIPLELGASVISRSGWALFDDSTTLPLAMLPGSENLWVVSRPPSVDWYFFGHGHDYPAALADAALIFGPQPLPPRFTLGFWYSRYYAYTDREIEKIVDLHDLYGIPLDVIVLDMDWHLPGWTGYTFDRDYFPDPAEFLDLMHRRGLRVTLNLHPAEGVARHEQTFDAFCARLGIDPKTTERIPLRVTDPRFMAAYFDILHHPLEAMGVDFWWMDWQQGSTTDLPGLDPLTWLNHLHWEDMAQHRRDRRPICFSRFGGIGSNRYPIGFSGDTFSTWSTLAYQVWFTATAANVLYGYWSHDIGGHQPGSVDGELFLRWTQFGVFSPILRAHTSKNPNAERRLWQFASPYRELLIQSVHRRYEMVPYIYTENRRCFENGLSLVRPLYYRWPESPESYERNAVYQFGSQMIVAPIVQPAEPESNLVTHQFWLPEGDWYDIERGRMLRGGQTHTAEFTLAEIPHFVRPGSILPGQPDCRRLVRGPYQSLLFRCYPGASGSYELYEDEGFTADYLHGEFHFVSMRQERRDETVQVELRMDDQAPALFRIRRNLEINLEGTFPPSAVTLNGQPLARCNETEMHGWWYNGQKASLIIRVQQVDLRHPLVLSVTSPAIDHRLDGWRGLMRRLDEVALIGSAVSDFFPVHPKERLPIRLAQAGHRATRHPETMSDEVNGVRSSLDELRTVLKEYRQIYVDRGAREQRRIDLLSRAIRLAATL